MPAARAETADAEACQYIVDLIYERCRIKLHDGKTALIKARLGKRIRHHGYDNLAQYCEFLRAEADEAEFTLVVDALTTNFTSFLREEEHFNFLVNKALPSVLTAGRKQFRVWSAACSSGEEPYTIAMYLAEHFPPDKGWDWHVSGTDISSKVLAKARLGIYAADRVESIPPAWLRKYFQKGTGQWDGHYRVKSVLANRVSFQSLNLTEPYEQPHAFDVVFCRNVMIYFDRATQQQLVTRLHRHLVSPGYLLIGHSESLNGLDVPYKCLGPSIYQRS